jgi:hypothetical protein
MVMPTPTSASTVANPIFGNIDSQLARTGQSAHWPARAEDGRQTAPYFPEFEPDIFLVEPQPQPQPRHGTPSAWIILCTVGSITSHWVAA